MDNLSTDSLQENVTASPKRIGSESLPGQAAEAPEPGIQSNVPTGNLFALLSTQADLNLASKQIPADLSNCADALPSATDSAQAHLRMVNSTTSSAVIPRVHQGPQSLEAGFSPAVLTKLASKVKSIDGSSSKHLLRPSSIPPKMDCPNSAKSGQSGLNAGPSGKSQ